jgi:hypothetical protein
MIQATDYRTGNVDGDRGKEAHVVGGSYHRPVFRTLICFIHD